MASDTISTAALLKEAISEARELVQLEVRIAREEIKEDVQRVKRAAIVAALAAASVLFACAALTVALIFALGATLQVALLVALGFAVLGGVLGAVAYAAVPKSILPHTRQHLMNDVNELKEHAP
jgi:uncharacterized membrane protein YqjE